MYHNAIHCYICWQRIMIAASNLYLGSSDLLPQAHEKSDPLVSIAFTLLGFLLIFVITRLLGV
jgi:zinc transporter ZupT